MFGFSQNAHKVRLTSTESGDASQGHVRRISATFSLACGLCMVAVAGWAAPPVNDSWTIRIVPGGRPMVPPPPPMLDRSSPDRPSTEQSRTARPANPVPDAPAQAAAPEAGRQDRMPPGPMGAMPAGLMYRQVYDSIPFSHAEYAANPSYRHEMTMAILFNQMPSLSIVKQSSPSPLPEYGYVTPYLYRRWDRPLPNFNAWP